MSGDATPTSVADMIFANEDPEVTRPYAEALINAADKEGQIEAVLDELDAIESDILKPYPQFAELLCSPSLTETEKDRILVETFEGRALPIVVRFFRVLMRHGRFNLLRPIAREARAIWDKRENRQPVLVRSAAPLDDAQQATLHDRLARMLNLTPILHVVVDRSLIGGLIVQIGDDVYDASVRHNLEQLRHRLIEGKTHEIQSRRDHFSHSA
jgi:F-type H+-transporting ATPase subunit delta